jgi:hypothetical protein
MQSNKYRTKICFNDQKSMKHKISFKRRMATAKTVALAGPLQAGTGNLNGFGWHKKQSKIIIN